MTRLEHLIAAFAGSDEDQPVDARRTPPPDDFNTTLAVPAPRDYVYRPHVPRGELGLIIGPPNVGKSTFLLAQTLAVASGLDLLGQLPDLCGNVLYWNADDTRDEIERRVLATAQLHRFNLSEIRRRLHLVGRETNAVFATKGRDGPEIDQAKIEWLIDYILRHNIVWVVLDPLKGFHQGLDENSNDVMDQLARGIGTRIADATGAAVSFSHHNGKSPAGATTARGGSALLGAARTQLTLAAMTADEGERYGVGPGDRTHYVSVEVSKDNFGPTGGRTWFHRAVIALDNVGVVAAAEPWSPPDIANDPAPDQVARVQDLMRPGRPNGLGDWRYSEQAEGGAAWAGHPIAEVLELDLRNDRERRQVRYVVDALIKSGALAKHELRIAGRRVPVVRVGQGEHE